MQRSWPANAVGATLAKFLCCFQGHSFPRTLDSRRSADIMLQKRLFFVFISILLASAAFSAGAQVVPSAYGDKRISVTVGGMGSIFQPDYEGASITTLFPTTYLCPLPGAYCIPAAQDSQYPLLGVGAYVDVKYNRWIQIEAEGRWLRFNQYQNISQDNYLIGPRVPIHRFWKAQIYGKALWGKGKMTFPPNFLNPTTLLPAGRVGYTDLAFGGGADIKLSRRFSLRLPDLEYQYWPKWSNASLKPYGASVGIGYKIF
jgi:hypothetical protein